MNNKPSSKKATVVTVIFCILLVLGIVLTMTVGACNRSAKVRSVTITFAGSLNASNLQSALEKALEGSVVLNEIGRTTTAATTTTTTTTTAATTTAATTEGAAAAAETTAAADTATTTADASASTTATTAATTTTTTTTTSASDFKSGKMVATVSNCDEKTDDDIRRIFNEVFEGKDYQNYKLTITDVYEVAPTNAFSWTQVYACVILLIVVFVYCLIRFYSIGALASAVSVVIPAIVAVIGSIGAALICNIFADISISAVAAVATASAVIFGNIVLENVKSGSDKDSCTVISVASVVAVLLVLVAIVSVIGWNGEIIFSCIQYAVAVVFAAISALAYVRCILAGMAPKALNSKKKSNGKRPVIK